MFSRLNKPLLAVAVSGLLVVPHAQATNGYFMHGYSTKEKALAGAGAALSQDAMASATNPAGMMFVGDRMDLGIQLFSPSPRKYTATGPATNFFDPVTGQFTFGIGDGGQSIESENDFFLIPHFAYNKMLDNKSAAGISVYGNGGMNTEYEGGIASVDAALVDPTGSTPPGTAVAQLPGTFGGGPFGDATAGVNLEQMFFNFSYAYKLDEKNALGASLILVGQRFAASGLAFFASFSADGTAITGNQNSYSYGGGIKLGYQGTISDGVRLGASYQSKMSMGEFDEYKGLFAESGGFDIPSTYTLGLSVDLGPSGTIVADYQRIMYTDVPAIANPFSNLFNPAIGCMPATPTTPAMGPGCFGGSSGAGFGWEDIGILKLGYQWQSADTEWRLGFSHSDQPIPDTEVLFNILAPAVIQNHLTFGFTMDMGSNQELNFAAAHALNESVSGPNPFDPQQQIEIEMSQWDFQLGWAWKY